MTSVRLGPILDPDAYHCQISLRNNQTIWLEPGLRLAKIRAVAASRHRLDNRSRIVCDPNFPETLKP